MPRPTLAVYVSSNRESDQLTKGINSDGNSGQ
jgi:hypothetical protein